MLPDHESIEEKVPQFQTFVTWAFYASLVLIGYGILGKFDNVDKNFDAIRIEMASMNIKLAQIFERQGFNDKEIQDLRNELARMQAHERRQISKEEK